MSINIVLTMAGKYSRFKLFGNNIPKYLLPLGTETILAEVIKQLRISVPNCEIYLIANKNDQIFFPIVRSIMGKNSINIKSLIYIDDTSSQLETALSASDVLPNDQLNLPVAFANIDTILFNRAGFFQCLGKCSVDQAVLDTFNAVNKNYSYARIGDDGKIIDVVDKSLISNYACSGLYGFGSYTSMTKIAEEILQENGESNFTDIYRKYIDEKRCIHAYFAENMKDTIVLGTPEEYVINIHRF